MPSMVHAPLITPTPFFKDKSGEHLASAFTAVNGRNSPPSPPRSNAINVMTSNSTQPRPLSRHSPERQQGPRNRVPDRDNWSPPRPAADAAPTSSYPNGYPNGQQSSHQNAHPDAHPDARDSNSPTLSDKDNSPLSPGKRKRSASPDGHRSRPSPNGAPEQRRCLDSNGSMARGDSPNTIAQVQQLAMDPPQPRTLPPVDRIDTERSWAPSHDSPYNGYHEAQHRDLLRTTEMEPSHSSHSQAQMSAVEAPNGFERSSTTEVLRSGVQVDPKKRKRQFANRTKTGCGTCRRRKKKCDEAKPECNNCLRGGFICEGYANKVSWPKNGPPKPHPPLQAKDRFPDPAQLYHSHGTPRDGYPDPDPPNGTDGGRGRPIVVEEHDRPPARNNWAAGGWSDPPRSAYSQEQRPHTEYAHALRTSSHGRPASNDQHVPPSTQAPHPPRTISGRIYDHTTDTMRDRFNHGPPVTTETQHSQQPLMVGPGGPPPPSHYTPLPPPRHEKSEKAKMMDGEPFYPFDRDLLAEREKCKSAVFRYNNTNNPHLKITGEEHYRNLRAILAASWNQPFHGSAPAGHLGLRVYVDTPFMCDYGYNIHIGNDVEIGTHCKFLDSGEITIGSSTTICAGVTIDTIKTPTDPKAVKGSNSRRTSVASKVHIGKNVWIGANCTILAGVSIGEGAIIHPGSVVTRDIPENCIWQSR